MLTQGGYHPGTVVHDSPRLTRATLDEFRAAIPADWRGFLRLFDAFVAPRVCAGYYDW